MSIRKIQFVEDQYYHIFNRGVDKRRVFNNENDVQRFFQSMKEFNTLEPIGSIYENSFTKDELGSSASKLVEFIAYCLNPNHYHFILRPVSDKGIEKFMQRLGTGYTKYFNYKNKRTGVLFQGPFKAVHLNKDDKFLRTVVYVNLNDKIHQLGSFASKLSKSSWDEYIGAEKNKEDNICNKKIVLNQFKNLNEFKKYTKDILPLILVEKEMWKEIE